MFEYSRTKSGDYGKKREGERREWRNEREQGSEETGENEGPKGEGQSKRMREKRILGINRKMFLSIRWFYVFQKGLNEVLRQSPEEIILEQNAVLAYFTFESTLPLFGNTI